MKTNPLLRGFSHGAPIFVAAFFFCLLGCPPIAIAADTSISELLEQGVYSEETKGDLDSAMQLYQQVIAKADAGQALAAQAQFRLANCLDKKKDYAAATKAFEKLVRDYPNQKDLVALANEYLSEGAALLPAPWVDGEELQFKVSLQSGFKVGVARFSVASDTLDGRKIWRLYSRLFAGMQQWSRIELDAGSFKPIHCRWKHSLLGESDTVYTSNRATVKIKGKDEVKNVDLAGAVYDNEQAIQLMRRLPLAAGYSMKVNIFSGLSGGSVLPLQLDVTGPEKITVPAGTFDCFKVELNIKQTFWFSADAHRYLVKFEAGGAVVELTAVTQISTASERVADSIRNFSILVPAGWMTDRKEGTEEGKRTEFVLLDPSAIGTIFVKVENLDNFDATTRTGPRAFADYKLVAARKYFKKYSVRADSGTESTIAGNPAVGFVADVVIQGDKRQVVRCVYAFVDGQAVDISAITEPADCENFAAHFDAIVASYQSNQTK